MITRLLSPWFIPRSEHLAILGECRSATVLLGDALYQVRQERAIAANLRLRCTQLAFENDRLSGRKPTPLAANDPEQLRLPLKTKEEI